MTPWDMTGMSGLDTVVITGLSGAGRSTAAKCFEDLGYYVVDNLPAELIATLMDLGSRSRARSPGWLWSWTCAAGRSPPTSVASSAI